MNNQDHIKKKRTQIYNLMKKMAEPAKRTDPYDSMPCACEQQRRTSLEKHEFRCTVVRLALKHVDTFKP